MANAVRSRHGANPNASSPKEISSAPSIASKHGGSSTGGGGKWEWVSCIDQMPLWGNVASDEAVQAALRDARAAKQFPANFLKPQNRLSGA